MFLESKWRQLISFSWPLLKLEPQIYAGCLGFTVCLLQYSGLTQGEIGGERGSGGHIEKRWLPAAGSSGVKQNSQANEHELTHCSVILSVARPWCVNITGSINLTADLSLVRYVCVSLIEVDKGQFTIPRWIKCWKRLTRLNAVSEDKCTTCRINSEISLETRDVLINFNFCRIPDLKRV